MNNINNNYYNYFLKNYSSRRLKESIIYGIEIDYNKNILFILTDYGHISLFSINNLNKCPSKTLIHSNLPIYCSYYYNYNNKQILFSGGNDIIGWNVEILLDSLHGTSPEGNVYRHGNNNPLSIMETYCLTGNTTFGHLYSGGSEGIVYSYDIETGKELHQYHGHQSSIHSLNIQNDSPSLLFSADETGVVCIWDLRASSSSSTSNTSNSFTTTNTKPSQRGLVSKTNISASVLSSNLLTRSNNTPSSFWTTSMTLDYDGNFLYLAGGYSQSQSQVGTGTGTNTTNKQQTSSSSSSSNQLSSGWIASVYLGGANRTELSVRNVATSPNPIQAITLQNNYVISGGFQPGIKYYESSTLEEVSSVPTSSPSIYSLKSFSTSDESESLLAVGGSFPVVDLYAIHGHRAKTLYLTI